MITTTGFGTNCRETVTFPALPLPAEEEKPIEIYEKRHLRYLKEHRKITSFNLLTGGKLNSYLADIDQRAQDCPELLVELMKQVQGITEQPKTENALEWAWVMEILNREIIYA